MLMLQSTAILAACKPNIESGAVNFIKLLLMLLDRASYRLKPELSTLPERRAGKMTALLIG